MLPERIGRRARLAWAATRIAADAESARRIAALGRPGELTEVSGELVEVRLRPLGGRAEVVRSGTADVDTLWTTFIRGHHLPPPEVARRPIRRVWDLGCNAGLTMVHLAVLHP